MGEIRLCLYADVDDPVEDRKLAMQVGTHPVQFQRAEERLGFSIQVKQLDLNKNMDC